MFTMCIAIANRSRLQEKITLLVEASLPVHILFDNDNKEAKNVRIHLAVGYFKLKILEIFSVLPFLSELLGYSFRR